MTSITGECFCGEIRYQISGTLSPGRSCHCSRCRKAFSGAGSAMTMIDPQSFSWLQGQESISRYINKAGIGLGFCRICGSTLCAFNQGDVMGITLGCLNDDPAVEIADHIFVGSKACWDDIGGTAPQYDSWPDDKTVDAPQ
ncbi:GFA family protein [Rhodovibrionaceae bacterium A322]